MGLVVNQIIREMEKYDAEEEGGGLPRLAANRGRPTTPIPRRIVP